MTRHPDTEHVIKRRSTDDERNDTSGAERSIRRNDPSGEDSFRALSDLRYPLI